MSAHAGRTWLIDFTDPSHADEEVLDPYVAVVVVLVLRLHYSNGSPHGSEVILLSDRRCV